MDPESVHQRREALEGQFAPWTARTTAQLFDLAAARHPDRYFVLTDERCFTYREMQQWSCRLAAGLLATGVRQGDHIAVDMANYPEFIALKLAIARVGAVSVAINFLLRHEELKYILEQSQATMLITMDRFRNLDYLDSLDRVAPGWEQNGGGSVLPHLRHVFVFPVSQPADSPTRGAPLSCLAAAGANITDAQILSETSSVQAHLVSDILYTSVTTGRPKGVMLTHDGVVRTAYSSALTRAFQDGRRIGYAMPMYHVFGYVEAMIAVLFVGGAIVPQTVFDPATMLSAVARHEIDELICVPTMTSRLLEEATENDYDLSHLTTMFSSGTAHPPQMWQQILATLKVSEVVTAYGQTETTASATCTLPGDPLERYQFTNGTIKPAGAAGDPELGGAMAIYKVVATDTGQDLPNGEIGELMAKGPSITPGYFDKPEETAALFTEDGWMHTGDLGRIDDRGYLVLTGRIKESYRCGGELVLPSEVESVLGRHPTVKAAHIIGLPHDRMGEVGCAFVVAADSAEPSEGELIAYCTSLLARFKVPAHVIVIPESELPVTVTGRVQKFQLTERATAELARRVETAVL